MDIALLLDILVWLSFASIAFIIGAVIWGARRQVKKHTPQRGEAQWTWNCYDCNAHGAGTEARIRRESTNHCFNTGHSVGGNAEVEI
jgi:hypothetical protein